MSHGLVFFAPCQVSLAYPNALAFLHARPLVEKRCIVELKHGVVRYDFTTLVGFGVGRQTPRRLFLLDACLGVQDPRHGNLHGLALLTVTAGEHQFAFALAACQQKHLLCGSVDEDNTDALLRG